MFCWCCKDINISLNSQKIEFRFFFQPILFHSGAIFVTLFPVLKLAVKNMARFAIIVAGGSGSRFGGPVPKQFRLLAGRPVLMHTLERFVQVGASLVLVLPAHEAQLWRNLCRAHGFEVPHQVVAGGNSRFHSVRNGLSACRFQTGDLVAVHDGVRPLASVSLIEHCFQVAASTGSAVPAVPVTDTIRQLTPDGRSHSLTRSQLRAVQTPQTFNALRLTQAYAGVGDGAGVTDDASVWEQSGQEVTLVPGEVTNIKITHPADLAVAQLILTHE